MNAQFLKLLGERIRAIEESGLNAMAQRALAERELADFLRLLQQEGEKAAREAGAVFGEAATRAALVPEKARFGKPALTTSTLAQIVRGVSDVTEKTFSNLGRTTAVGVRVMDLDGRVMYEQLETAYIRMVDDAISRVVTGSSDYKSEVRHGLKQIADSGIRVVDYESGYSRRMDASLRQNITDGVRSITARISAASGRSFGADGVEIDAHNYCAPDHLPFQGRMFSNAEFEKILESLQRPFET